MILLNFSHPLTPAQIEQVESYTGETIQQVVDFPVQFQNELSFLPQLEVLFSRLPLNPQTLQTEAILVNPPSLNFITALVLAELHGRMGFFPPVLRMRPAAGSLPPCYEVAEVLNLQAVRDHARQARYDR